MRTVKGPNLQDLPPGYELVRYDSGTLLALPSATAGASRAELMRRQDALDDARRKELHELQEAKSKAAAAERSEKAGQTGTQGAKPLHPIGDEPAPGYYRVIRKWAEFANATDDPAKSLRSADADVNERHAKLRALLIDKGPDRRIARPQNWREAIDGLEASLPHFREPIRLLRNSLALADATQRPVRIPPMLLLGPPGVGKTYFTHRVAELLGAPHASIAFDQSTSGSELTGSAFYWGNSSTGLLFNLICMGEVANPVVLLDELDKSCSGTGRREVDPLAQLHGALEPQTSRCTVDVSIDFEFDSSLVSYVGTANTLRGLTAPILSRMEVFSIDPPEPSDSVEIARAVVSQVLSRLNLQDVLGFERKGLYVLAHLSPRLMLRTAEKAIAAAVVAGQGEVREWDVWAELGRECDAPQLH